VPTERLFILFLLGRISKNFFQVIFFAEFNIMQITSLKGGLIWRNDYFYMERHLWGCSERKKIILELIKQKNNKEGGRRSIKCFFKK